MLVAHYLPELGADLVAALAALDVEDLPHGWISSLVAAGGRGAEGYVVNGEKTMETLLRNETGGPDLKTNH